MAELLSMHGEQVKRDLPRGLPGMLKPCALDLTVTLALGAGTSSNKAAVDFGWAFG